MSFSDLGFGILPKLFIAAQLGACPVGEVPYVDVHFAADPPFYSEQHAAGVLKKSMAQDKESTLATDKRSVVLGVTTSLMDSNLNVSFGTLTDTQDNQCIYVERITFWITYSPAVFISSDILDLPCTLRVTRAHEAEHMDIDVKAIQEYLPRIRMDMLLYLQSLGYQGFGPYPQREAAAHQQRLMKEIIAASKPMTERLKEARRKRQGSIDTPENYRREAEKCPDERPALQHKFRRAVQ